MEKGDSMAGKLYIVIGVWIIAVGLLAWELVHILRNPGDSGDHAVRLLAAIGLNLVALVLTRNWVKAMKASRRVRP